MPIWHSGADGDGKQLTTVQLGLWFSPWFVLRHSHAADWTQFEQLTDFWATSWSWLLLLGAAVALEVRRKQQKKKGE
jgi:hypothetical protein